MRGLEMRSKTYEKTEKSSDSDWDSLEGFERQPYSSQEFGKKLLEISRALEGFGREASDLAQMRGEESRENNTQFNSEPANPFSDEDDDSQPTTYSGLF